LVLVAALLLPLVVAAILVPFREQFADPAAALVLIAVVVGVAVVGTRPTGYLAAVSAALWFDFFLTRPYNRFAITHRPDIETTISLFVVGVIVTELAARSRSHRRWATTESDYVDSIYRVSELVVSSGVANYRIIEGVRDELVGLLHLRDCHYESGPGQPYAKSIDHDGQVIVAGLLWDADTLGLPGPNLELRVEGQGYTIGRFLLDPTPGLPVSRRQRLVAVALADHVGAALQRRLRSA
jgi:hypothetical protein